MYLKLFPVFPQLLKLGDDLFDQEREERKKLENVKKAVKDLKILEI